MLLRGLVERPLDALVLPERHEHRRQDLLSPSSASPPAPTKAGTELGLVFHRTGTRKGKVLPHPGKQPGEQPEANHAHLAEEFRRKPEVQETRFCTRRSKLKSEYDGLKEKLAATERRENYALEAKS